MTELIPEKFKIRTHIRVVPALLLAIMRVKKVTGPDTGMVKHGLMHGMISKIQAVKCTLLPNQIHLYFYLTFSDQGSLTTAHMKRQKMETLSPLRLLNLVLQTQQVSF